MKTILSLCDYSGVWCAPYREAGYNVVQIDLKHGQDVRLLEFPGEVHGILCAPVCTMFARSGAWARKREKQAGTYDAKIRKLSSLLSATAPEFERQPRPKRKPFRAQCENR